MLLSKLDAMSVGPFWLLSSREEASSKDDKCPVCGESWLQSADKAGSVIAILASPLSDEIQRQLLENCLAAIKSFDPSIFALHVTCSGDMTAALTALKEQIAAQSPDYVIVFGHSAAQLINPEFIAGKIHPYAATKLVATHHPSEMIATPALKAQVWADLCLLHLVEA